MTKQKDLEEWLDSTYLVRRNVSKRDLGLINQPSLYRNFKKPDRNYNYAVEHARADLKLLNFFLSNMKPKYRTKILQSDEFQNVIQSVMDISMTKFSKYTQEEKDNSLAFTVQMFAYCLETMTKNMPTEFLKPLLYHIEPLNDLMESIYQTMKKSGSKDIPPFRQVQFPFK